MQPGFFASNDFATLFGAADLAELIAVASSLDKSLSAWALIRPTDPKQQLVLTPGDRDSLDPLAAESICGIHYPQQNQPCPPDEPWARNLLGLLGYAFDWAGETTVLSPIWHGSALLAIVGIIGKAHAGNLPAEALALGSALAVRKLHEVEELRRDVEGHKDLLPQSAKSIVLAKTDDRVLDATEGGWAVLRRLASGAGTQNDANILPVVLRSALARALQHLVIGDLNVHFSRLPLKSPTTVEALHVIQFSRQLPQKQDPVAKSALQNLTPAERQVYPLIISGDLNKQIADKLNISVHTVKHHVSSILRKTGCSDRLLLVAKANTIDPSILRVEALTPVSLPEPPAFRISPAKLN